MLKFFKRYYDKVSDMVEITKEEAKATLLTTYRDNDMTDDMLTIPNVIQCRCSEVVVKDVDETGRRPARVLMPGLYNVLPMNNVYDDNGMRI